MIIKSAKFVCSSSRIGQCPKGDIPEFAFIGRSNVGKSSLINMLCGVKGLAKVSSTPGKTQLINHFIVDGSWYLVDLPGYGYAKVSKNVRKGFSKLITDYTVKHENLCFLFILVDSRHEPQRIDLEFIDAMGDAGVPFAIVFTKSDKLSSAELERNISAYKDTLSRTWAELPLFFTTSSEKRVGRDDILGFIETTLEEVMQADDTAE
ncbi:MAG: ribosome biogenesis GTP-binding protein YihA/YsxC [Rikenellaceae bacterium]|nr:ribosome biogenesis GTP-binding protein YihA/YsxC [Rikenellaceae bacterium]